MVDGLIGKEEKPTNTEVLGLLMDEEKLRFITNINMENIKGICKLRYFAERLSNPNKDPFLIHSENEQIYLALKCALQTKKGNRADQIVDALKHIIEDENKDNLQSIAEQIKK